MASDDYNVFYDPKTGQWNGKRQDRENASVVADTQQEAFEKTRELARQAGSEVSIHGKNEKIRAKHSYGNDLAGIKG